jgi:peptide deformylase
MQCKGNVLHQFAPIPASHGPTNATTTVKTRPVAIAKFKFSSNLLIFFPLTFQVDLWLTATADVKDITPVSPDGQTTVIISKAHLDRGLLLSYVIHMSILPIIETPDPRLKVKSTPVEQVDDGLRHFMDDMLETMYDAPGIGLAAIQVGNPIRVLVIDLQENDEKAPRFFINPEIVWSSDELASYNEGCLSVPDQYAEVDRPARIRIRYLDYDGHIQEDDMDGLMATCLQHEMDHLEGILFIDHLSRLKRDMILRKLAKAKRDNT